MVHAAALEAEQLNAVVHTREKLHTLVHTGDLDTVQLVHSYNLPPSAEKEQTVVEQLLLQASGLHQVVNIASTQNIIMFKDEDSKAAQETIISFKKPIFLDHLRDYYRYYHSGCLCSKIKSDISCSNCQFADTTIICSDETRWVLLKEFFVEKVDS